MGWGSFAHFVWWRYLPQTDFCLAQMLSYLSQMRMSAFLRADFKESTLICGVFEFENEERTWIRRRPDARTDARTHSSSSEEPIDLKKILDEEGRAQKARILQSRGWPVTPWWLAAQGSTPNLIIILVGYICLNFRV